MGDVFPAGARDFIIAQTRRILRSLKDFSGRELIDLNEPDEALARKAFEAPFVLASSGSEKDPLLNYGNRSALDLWEMDWETFCGTPGRKTAETLERAARERFLEEVSRKGFIDHYSGIRISRSGRRFKIQNALVWNVLDEAGQFTGQAASFERWQYLP